jgi:DnaJ family protein A protein 2
MSDPESESESVSEEESFYDILEVSKEATLAELKKKKKELLLKHHPDRLTTPEEKEHGEIMSKKINEAFEVLSDAEKRTAYDKFGRASLGPGSPFGPDGPFAPGGAFNGGGGGFPAFNPQEIFENMFGGARHQQQAPQKIQPIQIQIDMTYEDIYNGQKFTREIERTSPCIKCDGTGFEDKQRHNCQMCQGRGTKVEIKQIGPGMIQQVRGTCMDCQGSGNDKKSPAKCKKCKGDATIEEKHTVTFDIPQGVYPGDNIIIKNQGNVSTRSSTIRGDVIISVNELEHTTFKRGIVHNGKLNPANLAIEIELQLHEALCGFVKKFKHLDGEDIYIDQYEVVKDGELKVIKNRGLPYKGKSYQYGDLFVKFRIKYPDGFNENELLKKKLYEILTSAKYDSNKIHKIPKDKHSIELENIEDYNNDADNINPAYESDHEQDANQCATQ